jgi:fatty-acid desaturase
MINKSNIFKQQQQHKQNTKTKAKKQNKNKSIAHSLMAWMILPQDSSNRTANKKTQNCSKK